MRKLLDTLYGNHKLSIFVPLALAGLFYLLFVLFGIEQDKLNTVIATPVVSTVWFFGVNFIIYIQVKRESCHDWFIDVFELLITIVFGIYTIIGIWTFISSGLHSFNMSICLGLVTYSAIAWAHSKRLFD